MHEVDVLALDEVGKAAGVVIGRQAQAEVGGASTQVPLSQVVRDAQQRGGRGTVLAWLDRAEQEVHATVGEDALLGEPRGRHLGVGIGARAPEGCRRQAGQCLVRATGVDAVGTCTAQRVGLTVHGGPVDIRVLASDARDLLGGPVRAPVEDDRHDDGQVDAVGRRRHTVQAADDLGLLVPRRHDDEHSGERGAIVGLVTGSHDGIVTRTRGSSTRCPSASDLRRRTHVSARPGAAWRPFRSSPLGCRELPGCAAIRFL